MRFKYIFIFLPLLASISFKAFATGEDLVIDGDTLYVCRAFSSTILFPGIIMDAFTLCPKGEYLLSKKTKQGLGKLEISIGVDNPADTSCVLIVVEGSKDAPRKHRFIIYHALVLKPEEAIFDYSDLRKMYPGLGDANPDKSKNKSGTVLPK